MKKLRFWCSVGAISVVSLLPNLAEAHGPQIQIGIQNNQLVTRALFSDQPYDQSTTPIQRVFQIPLAQRSLGDASDGWYAQPNATYPFTGPGIASSIGGLATNSILGETFVGGLKRWNGSAFVDPGTEQVDVYRGATRVAGMISSDTGPFASFSYTAVANSADEHKTAFLRLLGDGAAPNTASDDGVYLVGLQLSTDQPGVASSEPFYFLLSKNGTAGDQSAALAFANANLVPEPSGVCLIGLISLAAAVTRRRRVLSRN